MSKRGQSHSGPSVRALITTLAALLGLTALSWVLAYAPLGGLDTITALGIATLKAGWVAMVFMDVANKGPSIRIAVLITFSFIGLICLGIAGDILFR